MSGVKGQMLGKGDQVKVTFRKSSGFKVKGQGQELQFKASVLEERLQRTEMNEEE